MSHISLRLNSKTNKDKPSLGFDFSTTEMLSLLIVFASLALSGCGNLNSIHRTFNSKNGGVLVDIKQRAIVVDNKGRDNINDNRICAEPSPDAMSAYAAELAGSVNVSGEKAAELAASMRESAAYTGLRTQSIQLLRDSMYRLCEAYMNEAINRGQYELLIRKYQKHMVALLAIEQLTGVIKTPVVTISQENSASVALSIVSLRNEITKIDESIKSKQALVDAKKNDTDLNIKKEVEETEAQIKTLNDDKSALQNSIENAKSTATSGNSTIDVSSVGVPSLANTEQIKYVTSAVKEIVNNILTADERHQICFTHLEYKDYSQNLEKPILIDRIQVNSARDYCKEYFRQELELQNQQIAALKLQVKLIENSANPLSKTQNEKDIKKLMEIQEQGNKLRNVPKE